MAEYLQIGADPSKWWLVQPFNTNQLNGQPLTLLVSAPIDGTLVLSGRAESVAFFNVPDGTVPPAENPTGGTIYLPTPSGASAHSYGYGLSTNEAMGEQNLEGQISTAMRNGTRLTIPLYNGTLVIDGATLDFAVLTPAAVGGGTPHDGQIN